LRRYSQKGYKSTSNLYKVSYSVQKDGFEAPNERTDSKNEVMTRQVFINKIVKLISILIS